MNKDISVIIVDDDNLLREMLKLIISSEGYHVVGEAANGHAAVTQAEKLQPTLMLLDINMPGTDGLQALQHIRRVSPRTRVLMISAEATLDKVRDSIAKGAMGFIVKPLNPAKVLDKIAVILKTPIPPVPQNNPAPQSDA